MFKAFICSISIFFYSYSIFSQTISDDIWYVLKQPGVEDCRKAVSKMSQIEIYTHPGAFAYYEVYGLLDNRYVSVFIGSRSEYRVGIGGGGTVVAYLCKMEFFLNNQ
jgi:hypothetical protein